MASPNGLSVSFLPRPPPLPPPTDEETRRGVSGRDTPDLPEVLDRGGGIPPNLDNNISVLSRQIFVSDAFQDMGG